MTDRSREYHAIAEAGAALRAKKAAENGMWGGVQQREVDLLSNGRARQLHAARDGEQKRLRSAEHQWVIQGIKPPPLDADQSVPEVRGKRVGK